MDITDYPINVFYYSTENETVNQERFWVRLWDLKEKNNFHKTRKLPFLKKWNGSWILDIYEIQWDGLKPVTLYMNIYEKGALKVPVGFGLKKIIKNTIPIL
jgi:hypothetical protein